MASDFFILANNEFQFYMFDTIGYKIVDQGYVRGHTVTCMLVLNDTMCVFGHKGSILTLWDTQKRVLNKEELEQMQINIVKAEEDKIGPE